MPKLRLQIKEFEGLVNKYRKANRYSVAVFYKKIGMSQTKVFQRYSNPQLCSLQDLKTLSRVLTCPFDDLLKACLKDMNYKGE